MKYTIKRLLNGKSVLQNVQIKSIFSMNGEYNLSTTLLKCVLTLEKEFKFTTKHSYILVKYS